ncbi:MAG: ATP-binding protein [Spirochaetaceae bacterium]|nr:ATP-binding protein [Spirochaetaceae bacterium]
MIKRKISTEIKNLMTEYPSVTLYGPRQCGKTTLAKNLFSEYSYANLEEPQTRFLAQNDPDEFFVKYPEPIIIDEIQRVPELLSTVQIRIDKKHLPGQYLITGSQQVPLKKAVAQSLAGRTAVINMLPLSLSELSDAGIRLDRDVQLISGFMPFLYKEKGHSPSDFYKSYIDTYLERDVAGIQAVQDMTKFINFLKLLAGRTGQLVNNSALSSETGVSSTTIGSWLSILEASHIIFKLQPWFTSRTSQIVKTPKIYFCDTGIAASLLGIETPSQMTRDPLMGNLFENLVVMEAVKHFYNKGKRPELFFFRNSNGLEVDLIHHSRNSLELFEIKSGKSLDKKFSTNMKNFWTHYPDFKQSDEKTGTVIYSGDDVPSFCNCHYANYNNISSLFKPDNEKFRLEF